MLNSDLNVRLKSLLLEDPSSSSSEPKKNDALLRRKQLEEISSTKSHHTTAPSLAEQMMATAASVQKSLKEEQRNEEQKRAKNATFGMKKGFLQKTNAKKVHSNKRSIAFQKQQQQQQQRKNLIVELDSKGNAASPNFLSQDDFVPSSNTESSSTPSASPLYLPEVQDALSSHLQSDQSKWASPTFLTSLSQHPTLSKGWNDPRYMAALESMKTHPKDTIEKLKADEPEILHWLMEFLGVMGDHFVMLGENDDNGTKGDKKNDKTLEEKPKLLREMGPLEEKAMRSSRTKTATDQKQHTTVNSLDDEVAKILSNDALRSILLDPDMQHVMEECASVSVGAIKVQYYMRHDKFGPKLRMLMQAGLLKVA